MCFRFRQCRVLQVVHVVGFGRPFRPEDTVSNAMKRGSAVLLAHALPQLAPCWVLGKRGWDRFRNGYVSAMQQIYCFRMIYAIYNDETVH
jgi:hypothetical protein